MLLPCYTPIHEEEREGQRHESGEVHQRGSGDSLGLGQGLGSTRIRQAGSHMVILESPERKASRQRLGRMIRKLRRAAQELGPLTPEQIAAEVAAVRTPRARRP